jgi:hypothetical protein
MKQLKEENRGNEILFLNLQNGDHGGNIENKPDKKLFRDLHGIKMKAARIPLRISRQRNARTKGHRLMVRKMKHSKHNDPARTVAKNLRK